MGFYQLERSQKIKGTKAEVWSFMSSPANLKEITPQFMGFDITSNNAAQKMYEGMIISYEVKPVLGIKMQWVTEITHVSDGHFFVDEQRIGPYKLWHHQHFLETIEGGVLMTDIVSYSPPFGFLGRVFNRLIIKNKLDEIFNYRKSALEKKYGKFNSNE